MGTVSKMAACAIVCATVDTLAISNSNPIRAQPRWRSCALVTGSVCQAAWRGGMPPAAETCQQWRRLAQLVRSTAGMAVKPPPAWSKCRLPGLPNLQRALGDLRTCRSAKTWRPGAAPLAAIVERRLERPNGEGRTQRGPLNLVPRTQRTDVHGSNGRAQRT